MKKLFAMFCLLGGLWGSHMQANPHEVRVAREVLENLYYAFGNFQLGMPGLKLVNTTYNVAGYSHDEHMIYLERKAYGICRSFGADSTDALAFLLGHELAHSYQELGWATNFLAYDHVQPGSAAKEKSADVQGAFGAALAGYGTLSLIEPLIERIYTEYELKGLELPNYPDIDDRKATARDVRLVSEKLYHAYKAGNYLTAIGNFEMAIESFNYVKEFYLGTEILNNLGMLYATQAMYFCGKHRDPYLYPFELNTESRLKNTRADDLSPEQMQERQSLLRSAQFYIREALELDPQNTQAFINQMCVEIQLGNYVYVIENDLSGNTHTWLESVGASDKVIANAELATAIAYAHLARGNDSYAKKAEQLFQKLRKHSLFQIRSLAEYNDAIFFGDEWVSRPADAQCSLGNLRIPEVDRVRAFAYSDAYGFDLDEHEMGNLFYEELDQSSVFVARWMGSPHIFQTVSTARAPGPGSVRIGQKADRLTENSMPNDYITISTTKGYLLYFPACQLLFEVDSRGYIREWTRIF